MQKAERPRNQNLPDDYDTEVEAEMALSGRGDVRPAEGLIGPHARRAAHTTPGAGGDEDQPPQRGSEYAPTARATLREAERHRLERERGRTAAGTEGALRDTRTHEVSREKLREAAKKADRHVAGTALRGAGGHEVPRK